MTLLHQAAQQAVEALKGVYQYGADTMSGRADGGPDDRAWQRAAVVEMTKRARDGIASLESALQQQEVPSELAARIKAIPARWNPNHHTDPDNVRWWRQGFEACRKAAAELASSPSTTRQQEAGSGGIGAEGWRRIAESALALVDADKHIKEISERYGLDEAAAPTPANERTAPDGVGTQTSEIASAAHAPPIAGVKGLGE